MKFEHMNQFSDEHLDESVNIKEIFEKYLTHLKWFVLSVLIFGIISFFTIRVEVPQYNVSGVILIKEKE